MMGKKVSEKNVQKKSVQSTKQDSSSGFKKAVCDLFGVSIQNTKNLEDELDKIVLGDYLNKLVSVKMFEVAVGRI